MREEGQLGGAIEGICQVCQQCPSKYRCPGCERQSCSLSCVRTHKTQFGCRGKRPHPGTTYLSVAQLTPEVLQNDFQLLEDAVGSAEHLARVLPTSSRRPRLQTAVTKRCRERNIELCLMPSGMARAQLNHTRIAGNQTIVWTVEWILLARDLPEHPTLLRLEQLRDHAQHILYSSCPEDSTVLEGYTALQTKHGALLPRPEHVTFFLRQEADKNQSIPSVDLSPTRRLWELHSAQLSWTLLLANRTIVEFPTIYLHPTCQT